MSPLRIAVVGVGHLGKEHARILSGLPDVELVGIVDVNADQAEAVARRCGTRAYTDYWPLLNLVDAAVIAVPTTHHHAIAAEFLRSRIAVLVEKPLALTPAEATALVALARSRGVVLQVGHIERFNPAFEELLQRPLQVKFIDCERAGQFTGRSTDIGAVLDLMIHDLDLVLKLVPAEVTAVDAVGVRVFGRHEDMANVRLHFADGCAANLSASRASATPVRRMRLWGPEGYAGLDFTERSLTLMQPSEQLRRHGLDARRLDPAGLALLKTELFGRHLEVVKLDRSGGDQLTRELEDFVRVVRAGAEPRVSGEDGCRAVALATRIVDSMRAHSWAGPAHREAAA
jgi:predicted dehydrogenase